LHNAGSRKTNKETPMKLLLEVSANVRMYRVVFQHLLRVLAGVVLLSTVAQAQPALVAPFTRITNGVIGVESAMSVAAAWGDYDNDGWVDLFVSNHQPGARNWLFRNNSNGTFTKITSGSVVTDAATTPWGVSWVDYNNDGWLDLIVASHNGSPSIVYRNIGGGSFARETAAEVGSIATDVSISHAVTCADYDNDGYLDLFAANGSLGQNFRDVLYRNQGNGSFIQVSNNLTTLILSSSLGSWCDYDNDGDMDLFVTHSGAVGNSLFRNDGAGHFVDATTNSGLVDIGESIGAAWGDYDNDGDLDLFVTNVRLNGAVIQNFFYRNLGDGTFARITTGELVTEQDRFVNCAWVDYDNDGWLDLFVTVTGQVAPVPGGVNNRLYRNQGDGTFVKVTQGRLVTDQRYAGSSAWGDYDNDGFSDVFVTFGTIFTSDRSALYHNDGNSNSWIKVKCVGSLSNRSAIGAKVRVLANIGGTHRWQMRQIVGSEGWVTFNSLDVLIGLGNATNIITLRVEWPSGIVQEFHNVAVKQTLTIVERTTLAIERPSQGEFNVTLKGPRQQRYRLEASTNLTIWSPMASLIITNVDRTVSFQHTPAVNAPQRFFRAAAE